MLELTPKYSVIIPVYNAEKTLRRCVDSLLTQQYGDAEIILVNDGSTDSGGEICKEYAASNRQVQYIDKANGGVSSARNAGIRRASGRYILFVDSDDSVVPGYFEQLDRIDGDGKYDFVWFSVNYIRNEEKTVCSLKPCDCHGESECSAFFGHSLGNKAINSPCNKRYSNKIVRNGGLLFDEQLCIGEDKLFNLQYALQCKTCMQSDVVLYSVYTDNMHSLSRDSGKEHTAQFQRLDDAILELVRTARLEEENRRKYLEAIAFLKFRSVYSKAKQMHQCKINIKSRWKEIQRQCDEIRALNQNLPGTWISRLIQIPVRLKLIPIIDIFGYILSKKIRL